MKAEVKSKYTLFKIVELCESQLGFHLDYDPNDKNVRVKAKVAWASRVKNRQRENPALYTLDHLVLAIAYCEKERMVGLTPLSIFAFVKSALEKANEPVLTRSIEDVRNEALDWEFETEDEHTEHWSGRLLRAMGPGLLVVLKEWKEAGRGEGISTST